MPDAIAPRATTAPALLFCYARPDHTRRTLDALARNELAGQTDLIIVQDGSRGPADGEAHAQTRAVIEYASGFRSVKIVLREGNHGLADNIIGGVSEVVQSHGRVIVLEDDLVTDRHFLTFMNDALDRYEDEPRVWHIGGWNYPIDPTGLGDTFLYRAMNCWGWATWADRWAYFDRSIDDWSPMTKSEKRAFNLDDAHDFHAQIEDNLLGRRKTWAIFWYASIFRNGGLCLNPVQSLVENIGYDGTGENCGHDIEQSRLLGQKDAFVFPDAIGEDGIATQRIRQHLALPPLRRHLRKLLRWLKNGCRACLLRHSQRHRRHAR